MSKVVCVICEWHGTTEEVLEAPNPFECDEQWLAKSYRFIGCPYCRIPMTIETEGIDAGGERDEED